MPSHSNSLRTKVIAVTLANSSISWLITLAWCRKPNTVIIAGIFHDWSSPSRRSWTASVVDRVPYEMSITSFLPPLLFVFFSDVIYTSCFRAIASSSTSNSTFSHQKISLVIDYSPHLTKSAQLTWQHVRVIIMSLPFSSESALLLLISSRFPSLVTWRFFPFSPCFHRHICLHSYSSMNPLVSFLSDTASLREGIDAALLPPNMKKFSFSSLFTPVHITDSSFLWL